MSEYNPHKTCPDCNGACFEEFYNDDTDEDYLLECETCSGRGFVADDVESQKLKEYYDDLKFENFRDND